VYSKALDAAFAEAGISSLAIRKPWSRKRSAGEMLPPCGARGEALEHAAMFLPYAKVSVAAAAAAAACAKARRSTWGCADCTTWATRAS
jgi:hypothetical protein